TTASWIKLSQDNGRVESEVPIRVAIDWEKLPEGTSEGVITFRGTGWQSANIAVTASKPTAKLRRQAKGYIEADGYIAIEAANYAKSKKVQGVEWQEIPSHGRTNSSISPYPISDISFLKPKQAPYVEYPVTLLSEGTVELQVLLAPSLPFVAGRGLRYAVAVGAEEPQIVNFLATCNDTDSHWELTVKDGVRIGRSQHRIKQSGPTTLKLFMVDPGVTVQRLLFDTGGLQPSYLGPPQSRYK